MGAEPTQEDQPHGSLQGRAREPVLREVNERIERGLWPGEQHESTGFRCECAEPHCNLIVELPATVYERVRANPRQFIVAPGHVDVAIERVVETTDRYLIVEKRGRAREIAEGSDPRA